MLHTSVHIMHGNQYNFNVGLCVCDGSGTFVERDYRLVTHDLRTSIYCSYLGTRRRMFENIGPGHGLASRTAGATSGCMQSGSSS